MLFIDGQVRDTASNPVAGAIVDVWHANTKGGYSFFDPSQSAYNLRRRIETDAAGHYRLRTILPSGYGCPPNGATQQLLTALGRHGNRPAHIHFFVEAPGYRKLTTQINIIGRPIPARRLRLRDARRADPRFGAPHRPGEIKARGLNEPFATIRFDFTLNSEAAQLPDPVVMREHAEAA